jgi:hypothetical protein
MGDQIAHPFLKILPYRPIPQPLTPVAHFTMMVLTKDAVGKCLSILFILNKYYRISRF